MDAEYYEVDEYACKTVNKAKEEGRRICAIGTTSIRAVESSITTTGMLKPSSGWTNIFVYPPYDFALTDSLITNFHLPKTSLLIMTTAFMGFDLTMEAYKVAIKNKYRFFSYGDAMFLSR
jgi:S-adenosylmethionine:tRNA ribosyltransferase-isomerase